MHAKYYIKQIMFLKVRCLRAIIIIIIPSVSYSYEIWLGYEEGKKTATHIHKGECGQRVPQQFQYTFPRFNSSIQFKREYLIIISFQVYHYNNFISTLCIMITFSIKLLMLKPLLIIIMHIQEVVKDSI